ncbi:helix-turn-helix domain-containing protein [Actinocorallia sp. API 0066]|uniref:helix-turn-helix domain-containing protein n=1 Tax=Actinocorallia sp. API 0066 TaxID=2896846 RepID=UPI001E290152|nr:helix-turn-helix transcriptional regulator [Actinocorallia sp. API 0066]MCD0452225.1 helix-turn-helix domain-containing protein [Actinocorallia sp. API 0066]
MTSSIRMTARVFLGKELRLARDAHGVTRAALAKKLFCSDSLIAAWESGRQVPRSDQLAALLTALSTESPILLRLLEDLVETEVAPEWTGRWLAVEKDAVSLLSYEHSIIPGLLQTEQYAHILIRKGQPFGDIGGKLQSRMDRQGIFAKDEPPTCVFIMDERVLHNQVGDANLMHDQLTKVIEVAKSPNVFVHVIPENAGYHVAHNGAFMIARFEGQDVVYQDGVWRGQVFGDQRDVQEFPRIWANAQSMALPKNTSLQIIEKAAQQWIS